MGWAGLGRTNGPIDNSDADPTEHVQSFDSLADSIHTADATKQSCRVGSGRVGLSGVDGAVGAAVQGMLQDRGDER